MFSNIIKLKASGDDMTMPFDVEIVEVPVASANRIKVTFKLTRNGGNVETAVYEYQATPGHYDFTGGAPASGWLAITGPTVTAGQSPATQKDVFHCELTVNNTCLKVEMSIKVFNSNGDVINERDEVINVSPLASIGNSSNSGDGVGYPGYSAQPRVHVFANIGGLTQGSGLEYGIKSADQFRCTSSFTATGNVQAYAILKGTVIIQPSDNALLVNLVLRPQQQSGIGFKPVQYFVYRGLNKTDFIDSADPAKLRPYANASAFIKKIYDEEAAHQNVSVGSLSLSVELLGIRSGQQASELLESYFYVNDPAFQHPTIFKGMDMGSFAASSSGNIGLDIVLEGGTLKPDLAYARKTYHEVNFTTTPVADADQKVAVRETILSFIDPAAFYGLHFEVGVLFSTSYPNTSVKKTQDLYDNLISKFITKNTVYVDIRNEHDYSYNYMRNYKDPGGANNNNINFGATSATLSPREYETSSWPIITYATPTASNTEDTNRLYLELRVNDNEKPVLYIDYGKMILPVGITNFVTDEDLVSATPPVTWTNPLGFAFPNIADGTNKANVATEIRLQYGRRAVATHTVTVPGKVIESKHALANLLGYITFDTSWDVSAGLIQWESAKLNRVVDFRDGVYNIADQISAGRTGIAKEPSRVLFTYAPQYYKNIAKSAYAKSTPSAGVAAADTVFDTSIFRDYQLEIIAASEASTPSVTFNLLHLAPRGGVDEGDITCLGLSRTELDSMKALSAELLSPLHRVSFTLDRIVNSTTGLDYFTTADYWASYYKYTLRLQGWDKNNPSIARKIDLSDSVTTPLPPIIVYSTDNQVFASTEFSNSEPPQTEYLRDFEEQQGLRYYGLYDSKEQDSTITVERHYSELVPAMKTQVEGFINDIALLTAVPASFDTLAAKINQYGKALFQQANTAAAASDFDSADDRPLYWSRIRMAVALKSHPYCLKYTAQSKDLVRLLEETTRNYTGVDFSAQPNLKKVLITGFDPFPISPEDGGNVKQSNPSGAAALALHGKVLQNDAHQDVALVQAMIIPVRYRDFDSFDNPHSGSGTGIVEKYIGSFISNPDESKRASMIVTISQANKHDFDIDRFATRTRGGGTDNLYYQRVHNSPSIYLNSTEQMKWEWIQTTLPIAMVPPNGDTGSDPNPNSQGHYIIYKQDYVGGVPYEDPVTHGMRYTDIPENWYRLDKLSNGLYGPPYNGDNRTGILGRTKKDTPHLHKGDKMPEGPGGNYLSNEIFYRVALMRESWLRIHSGDKLATGHFHVSMLQSGTTGKKNEPADFDKVETRKLILTVLERLSKGASDLEHLFTNDI